MTRMLDRSRRNPSFMKLLINDFCKKLLIPPKFVRLHPGTLPKDCTLKPTGTQRSWPVRTKLIDNHLFFKKGWKEFAQHYSLQYGNMLIFRYAQDSEFYVDIFDNSSCSRELVSINTAPVLPRQDKKNDPETAADQLILTLKFPSFKRTNLKSYVKRTGYLTHTHVHRLQVNEYILLQPIPREFTQTYMKESTNSYVKLLFLDKFWIVKLWRGGRRIHIKDWSNFAKENSLELGDVCVFQLIDAKDHTFEVAIFRKQSSLL
ncbi:B3 domain-containing protein LOC_Os12g40080-like [Apium graveolens]|uniref:B3 domain-containing protein LOC_Os12g40080-like n=1 Tax=Apium graveolens TaxID=4045 RepID=UPI003D7A72CE